MKLFVSTGFVIVVGALAAWGLQHVPRWELLFWPTLLTIVGAHLFWYALGMLAKKK